MSFDAPTAVALLRAFDVQPSPAGRLRWAESMEQTILERGLDIYREVCCALGVEATREHHLRTARASGSTWDEARLAGIHAALRTVPFHIQVVSQCSFLHFGTTLQLMTSGNELLRQDLGMIPDAGVICLNTEVHDAGATEGTNAWIEGCRVSAPVRLGGQNVLIGVEVDQALSCPADACLDVLRGRRRGAETAWFVRCYGVRDTFKDKVATATLCGRPLLQWLQSVGATAEDVWSVEIPQGERSLWNARVFPAEAEHLGYRRWLWMYQPETATPDEKAMFLKADRYSVAEMAVLADQDEFYAWRDRIRQSIRQVPA
jgi:fucokinase